MEEHKENYKFVEERLSEAFRTAMITAKKTNKSLLPVFPYLRPLYRYSALQFKMLTEVILLIIWGRNRYTYLICFYLTRDRQ